MGIISSVAKAITGTATAAGKLAGAALPTAKLASAYAKYANMVLPEASKAALKGAAKGAVDAASAPLTTANEIGNATLHGSGSGAAAGGSTKLIGPNGQSIIKE